MPAHPHILNDGEPLRVGLVLPSWRGGSEAFSPLLAQAIRRLWLADNWSPRFEKVRARSGSAAATCTTTAAVAGAVVRRRGAGGCAACVAGLAVSARSMAQPRRFDEGAVRLYLAEFSCECGGADGRVPVGTSVIGCDGRARRCGIEGGDPTVHLRAIERENARSGGQYTLRVSLI